MLVNQIIPLEIKERICVHCKEKDNTEDPIVYLIGEKGQGKSTETIRQAVFRRDVILSSEYDFYRAAGMKHASEASLGEVCHLGLRDLLRNERSEINHLKAADGKVHICIDNGRTILEELLTSAFNIPIAIDFMSLEA